jgi:hypothetical protein
MEEERNEKLNDEEIEDLSVSEDDAEGVKGGRSISGSGEDGPEE